MTVHGKPGGGVDPHAPPDHWCSSGWTRSEECTKNTNVRKQTRKLGKKCTDGRPEGSRTKSHWTKTHRTISKRTQSQEDKNPGGQNPRGTKAQGDKIQVRQQPRVTKAQGDKPPQGQKPMEDNIPGYRIPGGQNPKIFPRMMHLCIKARKIHDYRTMPSHASHDHTRSQTLCPVKPLHTKFNLGYQYYK